MRRVSAIFLALALAVSAAPRIVPGPLPSAAQDAGPAYVSDTYGFRVTWDDRIWYVVDQGLEDGWDEIVLSDSTAYVFISAGLGYGGQVRPCVDDAATSMARAPGIDDVAPLAGGDGEPVHGADDHRAFTAYRYTYTSPGGDTIDFVRYVECRTLVAGESVVVVDVVAPAPFYDEEFPLAQELIANLTLPSPGEPAPVFLSGQWRLAVAAADRGSRIRAAGLAPKPDKEWLLVVVDATNWGIADDELRPKDFALRLNGENETVRLAPASTVAAATELGTRPASANRGVPIPVGQTRRFTLVFQIPRAATGPALVRADSALPLDAVLAAPATLSDLPPTSGPPFLREARVDSFIGGDLLRITFLSDDSTTIFRLVGTDTPSQSDCYGQEAIAELDRLVGTTVLVERELGPSIALPSSGYLWTDEQDGSPVLFNQRLVAGGYARTAAAEADLRFGAWLAETERVAQADQAGLWTACTDPRERRLATPVPS